MRISDWSSDVCSSDLWDERTEQYYYHAFLKEQPDLNWRNPAVQEAMYDVLRFWFARGVDGFRIDVLWHMVKHADLPDNPINPAFNPDMGAMHSVLQPPSTDQPEVHGIAPAMHAIPHELGGRVSLSAIY